VYDRNKGFSTDSAKIRVSHRHQTANIGKNVREYTIAASAVLGAYLIGSTFRTATKPILSKDQSTVRLGSV